MPFLHRRRARPVVKTTTSRAPRRSLFGRRRVVRTVPAQRTHHTTPVVHHKRRPSIKDKVSGALMRLRGTLMNRRGVKAAGTRRMHGTDGRGARRPLF